MLLHKLSQTPKASTLHTCSSVFTFQMCYLINHLSVYTLFQNRIQFLETNTKKKKSPFWVSFLLASALCPTWKHLLSSKDWKQNLKIPKHCNANILCHQLLLKPDTIFRCYILLYFVWKKWKEIPFTTRKGVPPTRSHHSTAPKTTQCSWLDRNCVSSMGQK